MYFCLSLTVSNLVTSKFKEFFFLWEKSLIITKTCARILSFFLILLSNKCTCFSSRQSDWSMLYAFSHVHSGIDLHLRVKKTKADWFFWVWISYVMSLEGTFMMCLMQSINIVGRIPACKHHDLTPMVDLHLRHLRNRVQGPVPGC